MKQEFPVRLKPYEMIGGGAWLILYLTIYGTVLELLMDLLGLENTLAAVNGVYFFSCFAITALLFHRFLADSLPEVWGHFGNFLKALLFGFCLYELFEILMSLSFKAIYPNFATPNDDTISTIAGENYAVMWVGAVLLAPLTEETLLRGLVFGSIRRKNRAAAYVLTALLFAGMHMLVYIAEMQPADIVVNLLLYGLPGIALCACYEKGRTIWAPIVLHMFLNFVGMAAMSAG